MRFSTIKKRFPTAHIERAYGTPRENKEYISKTGVWADTDKVETSVPGTFAEWGELPADSEDKAPEMFQLMQELRSGKSTMEVLEEHPNLAFRIRDIELLRQIHPCGKIQCGKPKAGSDLFVRCQRSGQDLGNF